MFGQGSQENLGIIHVVGLSLTTSWLLLSLILYVAVALIGALVYAPVLNRQIVAAEQHGAGSPEYDEVARRSNQLGVVVTLLVVGIVYLMVVKPALWG